MNSFQQCDDDDNNNIKTLDNPSSNTTNSVDSGELSCKINSKLQELCYIYEYLNWPTITYGSLVSARIRYRSDSISSTTEVPPYYIILVPPLNPLHSIKQTDMLIYSVNECTQICKTLLSHIMIYDMNPAIKFIIHVNSEYVAAVSSMRCGLVNISKESAMVGKVSYYHQPFYDPSVSLSDDNNLPTVIDTTTSHVLFLKCNGALCFGSTIEEAFHYALHLTNACKIQTLTTGCNQPINETIFYHEQSEYFNHLYNQINNNEYFELQFLFYLSQSHSYNMHNMMKFPNNDINIYHQALSKNFNTPPLHVTSCTNKSHSKDYNSHKFGKTRSDENQQPLVTANEFKINIPKSESSREEILSYEFRANLSSSPSLNYKTVDDRIIPRRRSKRFKAKRCCSLTSGVEKAIAKKLYDNNLPGDT